jgi:poly(A) polymerase
LQPRFERRTGRSPFRLVEHLRFRAGYDFLLLRAAADEIPVTLGDWWTAFSQASQEEREQMIVEAAREGGSTSAIGVRRRRRRRGRGGEDATSVA